MVWTRTLSWITLRVVRTWHESACGDVNIFITTPHRTVKFGKCGNLNLLIFKLELKIVLYVPIVTENCPKMDDNPVLDHNSGGLFVSKAHVKMF